MRRGLALALLPCAALIASVGQAQAPALTWDGLVLVPSQRLDQVYLRPGADFRAYTKVIVEPTTVAFARDWQHNFNAGALSRTARVSDSQVEEALRQAVQAAGEIVTAAWAKGGYAIVQTPAPDAMRVKIAILDVALTSPEIPEAGRTHSYASEAGQATFVVEVYDSTSGALLGRAVDKRLVGNDLNTWRTSGSNRADFRRQVEHWANLSVAGVAELKALSPVKR